MRVGVGILSTAFNEISGDVDLGWSPVGLVNGDADGTGAVKEVVVDLVTVAAHDDKVFFGVPLNAVADEGDRGILAPRCKARALVAAEPVVEDEGVPSAHVHAVAVVVCQFAVPHAETPDAIQPHAVAGEAGDLAALDAKTVLVFTPFGAIGVDAVNTCSDKSAIQRQSVNGGSARLGQVEQAAGVGA